MAKTTAPTRTRIRKNDQVMVIAGADKGKVGRVLEMLPLKNRVLVEGVRVAKRSYKKGANPSLPQGGIHDKGMPIHLSNVMLVDPKDGTPSRIGIRFNQNNDGSMSRVRFAKSSGADVKDI